MNETDFQPWPKLARLSREIILTEKLDGTSAQIHIAPADPNYADSKDNTLAYKDGLGIYAGSRTRYITPQSDNFGFARWVRAHANELFALGEGRHYGEWWGNGIQRTYGLKEKRFSLFNTERWGHLNESNETGLYGLVNTVPVLYKGMFDTGIVDDILHLLQENGSSAVPGWMDPEGVVVFHTAANAAFKKTIPNDGAKGLT